ncbi:hypothetical protein SAMN05443999_103155 [Roseovarius azorensis]|uniref:DUF1989 domain-containing protein n=1 Tax=Roseovarius azorensis TaxID=1287727 RepID=A0A1H7LZ56_9RHOB|nr:urea carboxylase-associated family protein [Roseovarius azorensis]SEL03587.1 hypothetical protein SAMN05443999_103155 [Roseovarius azorensis]
MTPTRYTIPARRGKAARLNAGEAIRIINTHGAQVVDTWAFSADDMTEFMSMEHIRPTLGRIFPRSGDALVTNRRRPILHLEKDTSPGRHDTLIAACDDYRYGLLGCTEYHDNCTDNLHAALRQLGLTAPECPSPLNLWMNIPVDGAGNTAWGEPLSKPGDYVVLRAAMDCVVAMSACPQDILPINGASLAPTEAHFEIIGRG